MSASALSLHVAGEWCDPAAHEPGARNSPVWRRRYGSNPAPSGLRACTCFLTSARRLIVARSVQGAFGQPSEWTWG